MKYRTIIFSEEQIQGLLGIIETQGQEWDKYGRAAYDILKNSLTSYGQDASYQAMARGHAFIEQIKDHVTISEEFKVATILLECVTEFGKVLSLGLRNLDFEMDEETEYDISRWANECLLAGLSRVNDGQDWEPEYRKYELVKARGSYKKGSR